MAWSGYSEQGQGSNEKGPGSYALDVPGMPRAQARPSATGPVRAGVEAGRISMSGRIDSGGVAALGNIASQPRLPPLEFKPDPTAELMYRLGGARAEEVIKKREQEQFIKGAANAAAGQAMVEIANEQPWYSRIFGDTALVEGARAYTIKAGVAKWSGDHLANMDELAKKSPNEVPAYLNESISANMTGDTATDQQMTAELLSQVPQMVKEHTKRHYLYLQETAKQARGVAMDNTFAALGAWSKGSIDLDDAGYTKLENDLSNVLIPAPGVDEAAHWAQVEKHAEAAIRGGNVHLYRMMTEQGYIDRMPAPTQLGMLSAFKAAAPKALEDAMRDPALFDRLTKLGTQPIDRDALLAEMEAINDLGAGISGVPRELAELLSTPSRIRAVQANDRADAAVQTNVNKELQKQVQKAGQRVAVEAAVANGDIMQLTAARKNLGLTSADTKDMLGEMLTNVPKDQMLGAIVRTQRMGFVPDEATAMISKQVMSMRTDKIDEGSVAAFIGQYSALDEDGRAAVQTIIGDPIKANFVHDVYSAMEAGATSVEAAVASARMQERLPREFKEPDKGSLQEAIQDVVKDSYGQGFFKHMFSDSSVPDASETDLRYIGALVATVSKGTSMQINPKARGKAALNSAVSQGLFTFVGARPVLNVAPEETLRWDLSDAVGLKRGSTKEVELELDALMTARAGQLGINNDERLVLRLPGRVKEPIRYQIIGIDGEGREVTSIVTSEDAVNSLNTKEEALRSVRRAVSGSIQDLGPAP